MLKPLVMKKGIVLPPPQSYFEEWQAHVQLRTSETLQSVLQQHGAALRIQLRYKTYQTKVRALLKKTEKVPRDAQAPARSSDTATATSSTKAAVRERSVAGSSMALAAVAYNVRSSNTDSTSSNASPGAANSSNCSNQDATIATTNSQTLVFKAANGARQSYTSELRASRKDVSDASSSKWVAQSEWRLAAPQAAPSATAPVEMLDVGDSNVSAAPAAPAAPAALIDTSSSSSANVAVDAEASDTTSVNQVKPQTAPTTRTDGLVDIMHHSWLLASMEERCAAAAASVGASSSISNHSLRVADFRHTLLDLVFIARSGVGHTLHGRPPASVATHHARLLERVQHALASTDSDITALTADDTRRVARIFQSLQSDMLLPAVRLLGWLLTKTWRLLFDSVHVDAASLYRVLETIVQLQSTEDVSVVFAPTHKTHLDYLLISYVCFAYGVPLPRIAAGNNLDLPLIGRFLRANGSFFIRRSFRNDALYKRVLESYVHELLADGNPVEVFVEGGRSRHGRVGKPKLGFLSMFHTFTHAAKEPDAKPRTVLLVPIALDYDRVYEVNEYANQLLGKPKEPESIRGFMQSLVDIAFLKCGHAYVRFGAPLRLTTTAPLDATADELAVRMQTAGTITSTSIVAALLMWKRTRQTHAMLATRVQWLVNELEQRDANVAHVADAQIAAHALAVLKVDVQSGVLMPALEFPTRALELAFYRNHLLHVFLPELAVAGAIDALLRLESATVSYLPLAAVEETALMMWNFLQHICRHAPMDIAAYIPAFVRTHAATACTLQQRTGSTKEEDEDTVLAVDVARWRSHKLAGFALSLLWPFVDSLWLCAHGLWSLLDDDDVDDQEHTERAVVRRVQVLARELFMEGSLVHAEAFCSESIKQSLDFLVERGLIQYAPSTRDPRSRAIVFCRSSSVSGDMDSRCAFVQALVDEVHGWRKPTARARLWTLHATPSPTLTREDALVLMARASRNSKGGVYDKWMTPPPV